MAETTTRGPMEAGRRAVGRLLDRLPADDRRRRRLFLAVCGVLLAVVVAATLLEGLDGTGAPPDRSAGLVPANALVYVHVSTDGDRPATADAVDVLDRFPSFDRLTRSILSRLSTRREALSYDDDLEPWLGDEAAFALTDNASAVAGSLIVLDVTDRGRAEAFLRRSAGAGGRGGYRGVTLLRYGTVSVAFVEGEMLIGQEGELRRAIDIAAGRRPSLKDNPTYRRAVEDLPEDRAGDVYASGDGVRRVLAPQPGVLGAFGALLNRPALTGVGLALSAGGDEARVTARSILDPALARRARSPFRAFSPALDQAVPGDALAYLGVRGLDTAAGRLLGLAQLGGGQTAGLDQLVRRAERDLARRAGVNLRRDVLALFRGEVAVALIPSLPAPILTVIARTPDERRTREAFRRLQAPLAGLLSVPGRRAAFRPVRIGGTQAFSLRLGPQAALLYAVAGGRLILSTSPAGIRQVLDRGDGLADTGAFQAVLADRPDPVTSLVFLDFRALLTLAERTGLGQDRAYLVVRDDLAKVRAVGAATSAQPNETTAELTFSIP